MRFFFVYAHPEPQSFNGAMLNSAKEALVNQGHEIITSDLYKMQFNPISGRHNFLTTKEPNYYKQQVEEVYASETDSFSSDIKDEMSKLDWCDVLIFQFPLWWFGLPAILKGWVDRVFAMGKIYGGGKWYDKGVFSGKKAMLALTTGGGETMYSQEGLNGHMEQILYPINHGILYFVGFDVLPPFVAYSVSRVSTERRQAYLEEYKYRLITLNETPKLVFPKLSDYNETFQLKNK
jgi:NAD(P)H dehydrogenase (quinone)